MGFNVFNAKESMFTSVYRIKAHYIHAIAIITHKYYDCWFVLIFESH